MSPRKKLYRNMIYKISFFLSFVHSLLSLSYIYYPIQCLHQLLLIAIKDIYIYKSTLTGQQEKINKKTLVYTHPIFLKKKENSSYDKTYLQVFQQLNRSTKMKGNLRLSYFDFFPSLF